MMVTFNEHSPSATIRHYPHELGLLLLLLLKNAEGDTPFQIAW